MSHCVTKQTSFNLPVTKYIFSLTSSRMFAIYRYHIQVLNKIYRHVKVPENSINKKYLHYNFIIPSHLLISIPNMINGDPNILYQNTDLS